MAEELVLARTEFWISLSFKFVVNGRGEVLAGALEFEGMFEFGAGSDGRELLCQYPGAE